MATEANWIGYDSRDLVNLRGDCEERDVKELENYKSTPYCWAFCLGTLWAFVHDLHGLPSARAQADQHGAQQHSGGLDP
jgi:hypothetical protein